jgi:transcriptional regulator with XRE-family HTH domain
MANRLRAEMVRQNLSFRELAFLTQPPLSPGYLCRLASGQRWPSKRAALAVAKALRVSPARLWVEDGDGAATR